MEHGIRLKKKDYGMLLFAACLHFLFAACLLCAQIVWCLERPRSTSTSSVSSASFMDLKVGSGLEANSSLFIESKPRLRVAVDVDEGREPGFVSFFVLA